MLILYNWLPELFNGLVIWGFLTTIVTNDAKEVRTLSLSVKPQFLIAAPHSGAGKTTVTLGILRALSRKGLRVQPFKCGPDFLDPKHHTQAAGVESLNLDRFMMSDQHLHEVYARAGSEADVAVTEGVMGLFDGATRMEGSSADLARLLGLPILLVLNAKAMAYSVAAILYGFKNFCPDIHIAGVLFNFVDHASHYRILKEACEEVGLCSLGYLPVNDAIRIPSRHLGLHISADTDYEAIIEQAADHLEKHIDLSQLLEKTRRPKPFESNPHPIATRRKKSLRIAIAKDEAFNFLYRENVKALETLGSVEYFSPLSDSLLPDADLVYLPGGYPELHLAALSKNQSLLQQLRAYHEQGGRVLAECGGMMYLGQYIQDEQGQPYPMAGILDLATSMQQKKLSLGYRQVIWKEQEWNGQLTGQVAGQLTGHEFHYSQFVHYPAPAAIRVLNARNEPVATPIFRTERLWASYLHLYWGEKLGVIQEMLGL